MLILEILTLPQKDLLYSLLKRKQILFKKKKKTDSIVVKLNNSF